MRKIFIDCGSHDGCSVRKFKDLYDKSNEFEYFCFEINELLEPFYEDLKDEITLMFKGVGTKYEEVPFLRMGMTGGSTITKEKAEGLLKKQYERKDCMLFDFDQVCKNGELKKSKISTIDLSHWIKENFSQNDYIVLKMDIEGAEYKILNHLMENRCIKFLNELKIEFHNGGEYKYIRKLKLQNNNLKIDWVWDAMHPPYLLNKQSEEYYKTYEKNKHKYREKLSYEEKLESCKLFLLYINDVKKQQTFFKYFKYFLNDASLIEDWKKFMYKIAKKETLLK
jgi:FkbM family methyltransferase